MINKPDIRFSNRRIAVHIVLGMLLLAALGVAATTIDLLRDRGTSFRTDRVAQSMLNRGSLGELLREIGLVRTERRDYIEVEGAVDGAHVVFTMDLQQPAYLQVFWAAPDEGFDPRLGATARLSAGRARYSIDIPPLDDIDRLRIDFVDNLQEFRVSDFQILDPRYAPITFSADAFKKITYATSGLEWLELESDRVTFRSTNKDPILVLRTAALDKQPDLFSKLFDKRKNPSGLHYVPVRRDVSGFPSQSITHSDLLAADMPIISLSVDERDLHDPAYGLLQNRLQRGRQWERTGYVSWFEQGEHEFSTSVGVRFHGGKSRQNYESFRIYFGESRGSLRYQQNRIFDNRVRLRSLVIRHTEWPDGMPLNSVMGLDTCRLLGCETPEYRLAFLYLNGEPKGVYYLSEHQSWRQWSSRKPVKISNLYRFKSDNRHQDQQAYLEAFYENVLKKEVLSVQLVEEHLDLENISRHMLAHLYAANADFCQGIAILEDTPADDRWKFVIWDMDHGFSFQPNIKSTTYTPGWKENGIARIFSPYASCERRDIIQRLLKEDPAYKQYFIMLLADALNFLIAPENFKPIIDNYTRQLKQVGISHADEVKHKLVDFVENRPDFLRSEARELLDAGEVHTLSNMGDHEVLLNGFLWRPGHALHYFHDQTVHLSGDGVTAWKVNGALNNASDIMVKVTGDIQIIPISGNATAAR
jgi:hypothetical protein